MSNTDHSGNPPPPRDGGATSGLLPSPHFWHTILNREGGPWLGAVRSRIKNLRCLGNGESVRWGSSDVIKPALSVREVEEIAAHAVEADRREQDKRRKAADEDRIANYLLCTMEPGRDEVRCCFCSYPIQAGQRYRLGSSDNSAHECCVQARLEAKRVPDLTSGDWAVGSASPEGSKGQGWASGFATRAEAVFEGLQRFGGEPFWVREWGNETPLELIDPDRPEPESEETP